MNKLRMLMELAASVMFSLPGTVSRIAVSFIVLLFSIGVIHLDKFDVSNFGIPDEYLVAVVIVSVIAGFLAAVLLRRKLHDDAAEKLVEAGDITNAYELEYDTRYDLGTAAGLIIGIVIGICASPVVVDALFVGAGMWTFSLTAGACAIVAVICVTYILHFGIRKFIVNAVAWAQEVADTVKDTLDDVETLKETVDTIKTSASSNSTAETTATETAATVSVTKK